MSPFEQGILRSMPLTPIIKSDISDGSIGNELVSDYQNVIGISSSHI